EKVAPHVRKALAQAQQAEKTMTATDWYELGMDLEAIAPDESREAFRRALELEPRHVDSHLRIGRLLEEVGEEDAAERHYRVALAEDPLSAAACFHLGAALERLGRRKAAVEAYREALRLDPRHADACFHLARLSEQLGDTRSATRWLEVYRQITE